MFNNEFNEEFIESKILLSWKAWCRRRYHTLEGNPHGFSKFYGEEVIAFQTIVQDDPILIFLAMIYWYSKPSDTSDFDAHALQENINKICSSNEIIQTCKVKFELVKNHFLSDFKMLFLEGINNKKNLEKENLILHLYEKATTIPYVEFFEIIKKDRFNSEIVQKVINEISHLFMLYRLGCFLELDDFYYQYSPSNQQSIKLLNKPDSVLPTKEKLYEVAESVGINLKDREVKEEFLLFQDMCHTATIYTEKEKEFMKKLVSSQLCSKVGLNYSKMRGTKEGNYILTNLNLVYNQFRSISGGCTIEK